MENVISKVVGVQLVQRMHLQSAVEEIVQKAMNSSMPSEIGSVGNSKVCGTGSMRTPKGDCNTIGVRAVAEFVQGVLDKEGQLQVRIGQHVVVRSASESAMHHENLFVFRVRRRASTDTVGRERGKRTQRRKMVIFKIDGFVISVTVAA